MNAPDPFAALLARDWPLPQPMPLTQSEIERMADEYWREAIAGAHDDEPADDIG